MELGTKGTQLIESFEKCRLTAYRDSGGVLTIGWGHTTACGGLEVTPGLTISQAEADQQFHEDLRKFVRDVRRCVRVPLNQNEFDALVSFQFNTGALASSSLLRRLNAGDRRAVPAEFMKWDHAGGRPLPGLKRRRAAEVRLWLEPVSVAPEEDEDRSVTPERPRSKSMYRSKIGNASVGIGIASALEATSQVTDTAQQVVDTSHTAHDVAASLPLVAAGNWVVSHMGIVILLAITAASIAIWVWRRENMQEYGE
jgi:lysozyme